MTLTMTQAHPTRAQTMATAILENMHAPAIAMYWAGAQAFGFCILQKAKPLSGKRRRLTTTLMFAILACYFAEVLYYFARFTADAKYDPPHDAAIDCLGSILAWGFLSASLSSSNTVRWHPYFGAFVLQFIFETSLCLLQGLATPIESRYRTVPLVFKAIRAAASLVLVIDGFFILIRRQGEKGSDEEEQSLLSKQTSGSANQTGAAEYGAIPQEPSDEEEEQPDRDKEIKEQQAKRLEEEGGWYGYLKSFTVFLPYLWPKDDWVVMTCLALRAIHLIQGRVFNLLAPRELGIITNKLSDGATEMPWRSIALWTFYNWIKGYSGFGMIDTAANVIIQNKAFARLTLMAYKHVMNLSMDFHTNKSSGEVLKAVEQASSLNTIIELVLFDLSPILIDMVVAVWYVSHLFNTYMAFIILFMGAIDVWCGIHFTSWTRSRRRVYQERQRSENQVVTETLHNWHTVFYFNRATHEQDRYGKAIWSTIAAQYRYYFQSTFGHAFQDWIMTFGFMGCCIFAISQVVSGQQPLGNLITFIMYWETMMTPLYMMAYSYRTFTNSLIDAERLLQLLNTKPTVNDEENAKTIEIKASKVEFKDVYFAYDPRKQIIKNVNFIAEGGQTIAFVGETGGGKSTMLKLLSRAYDVTGGSISIDGQDLRSVTRSSLRDCMGLVPQDPDLFNTTIRENIRYGRLGATDAEIEDACRAAAVHDAIMEFPDKYNAKVGERGVKLSGGQLQRIAIARVLLRNPKIVLLDEATSAVDSAIEALIQEAFKKLSAGRTTFVIAHRLSTIVEADQILVIDKGEIIERGTHAELLEVGGKYSELWTKQTAGNSTIPSKTLSKSNSTDGDSTQATLIDVTPSEEDSAKSTGRSNGSDEAEGEVKKR
jgi:ABC-type transport system involved in Fe-S cluster assembly fused permease/ATPase subunit